LSRQARTWSQEFVEARGQSVSLPHDYQRPRRHPGRRPSFWPTDATTDGALRGLDRDSSWRSQL